MQRMQNHDTRVFDRLCSTLPLPNLHARRRGIRMKERQAWGYSWALHFHQSGSDETY
ncbi:hypothetical protein QL093DRAFT_2380096 [Fusarium oxysporum]|nr:hypothetical protein QL093DRAFT_2380096 [Fusarium oxysporum]